MEHDLQTPSIAEEARARRMLTKMGLRLNKAPTRHWTRKEYGAGYQIRNERNIVVAGCGNREYEMSFADVETFIAEASI
jgi:hypothetical protein